MPTITSGARSSRHTRVWAVVLAAAGAVALLSQPVAASASVPVPVPGKVGPHQFSTTARAGAAGSCDYAKGRLTTIAVTPPRAGMRAYWAEPHHGRLAVGQYVEFIARLSGLRNGIWTTLSRAHEYVLVATAVKRLPALPAFTLSRGRTSGYQDYRVVESLSWLRPTDNALEGSVTTTLKQYRVAKRWNGACPTPPASVAGFKAERTASTIKLAWTNRTPARVQSVIVRYARGRTPPAHPGKGHAVTLTRRTATQFLLRHLRPKTRYAFAIWACGQSSVCSSRRTMIVKTRAPRLLGTPTITASASGPAVSWTVSVDPNGRPATVQVTTDHGFDQTYTTGTAAWTSPPAGQSIGYSTTDHITVTVSVPGRASTTASASVTTSSAPPPASVSVSRGAACAGRCGLCILPSCAFIHVTTANFAGPVTCAFSSQLGSQGFVSQTYGADESLDSSNFYYVPGTWIQASCGGVTARTTW